MRRFFEILISSFKMALEEFRANKLRTFLSLFGITIGIFCIIGVLAAVSSLERNVQNDVKSLGTNSVYVQREDFSGQVPWWKVRTRPQVNFDEMKMIKKKVTVAENVTLFMGWSGNLEFEDETVSNVDYMGVTEDFANIQKIEIEDGRYLQQMDYDKAANSIILGNTVAEQLFGRTDRAVGKQVEIMGKKVNVAGLMKKKGTSTVGGFDFDNSIILPFQYMRGIVNEKYAQTSVIIQGYENIPMPLLRDEIQASMRSIRKLKPADEDNFSMNDVDAFGDMFAAIFSGVNLGGWAIAVLSLVVGMFGVANIMFVTVRERTSQIGLKKAIGAKRSVILSEFLLESAFLCILGGMIGLLLVYILTKIISISFDFPIYISPQILVLAISICIIVGILAGIIPAMMASKMKPVDAIRSK
jgi:putative ABC transport system permease protein